MQIHLTALPDLLVFEPTTYDDRRGSVTEVWQADRYRAAGLPDFVQDNVSRSCRLALRGLHYQLGNQGKLITVLSGSAFDVAVDLRRGSPTFGRWFGIHLHGEHLRQLWIPPGFAHGLLATSARMDVHYKLSERRIPEHERILRWDDPTIAIDWPMAPGEVPILSDRDRDAPMLDQLELPT